MGMLPRHSSEDRLWVATTPGAFDGELVVRRYVPATLEMTRSMGTRLTYSGVPQDREGAWSHVIEAS